MSEEKISREEFERLQGALVELAKKLREKDRHERGGTTVGEMGGGLGEAMMAVLQDPEYIRGNVAMHLAWWLGDREKSYSSEGQLKRDYTSPPGIVMLGTQGRFGYAFMGPEEVAERALRRRELTDRKAEHRINSLRENAKLCLDLADAFKERLQNEGGIRRVQ